MRTIKHLVIILIAVLALGSCRKIVQLSPIPHIEFTSFTVFDTLSPLGNSDKAGKLKFYFEDGDGNLGLQDPEGTSTDTIKNLYFNSYRKIAGIMVQITDTADPVKAFDYRIPYMERTGQNKILKGTISVTFLYTFYEPKDSDIIRYDFFIKDRLDNVSETVSTCEIPISVNGLYKN
jgi:hypothetical protein